MRVLKKLLSIRGVKYDWNETMYSLTGNTGTEYGVIAQEVQKEFPEMVSEGSDGYLEVDYVQLIPVMIEAIRELKNEIDNLKQGGS
jgi:hypothetical protein